MLCYGGQVNWFIFIVTALAVFRGSLLFSEEEGPLSIFSRMRRAVPAKSNPGRGIRCSRCWSVWLAAVVTGYLVWLGLVPREWSPLYLFALSGASVLLHRVPEG